jgi:hypothetical protein
MRRMEGIFNWQVPYLMRFDGALAYVLSGNSGEETPVSKTQDNVPGPC